MKTITFLVKKSGGFQGSAFVFKWEILSYINGLKKLNNR